MSTDRAEAILMEAIGKYADENPDQKAELLEALDTLLAITTHAASVATECSMGLMECMEMIEACRLSTSKPS